MHTRTNHSFRQDRNMPSSQLNIRGSWLWPIALCALTLFALAVRWYYVTTALVVHPVRGDAVQYVNYAWNLATHQTFAKDPPGSPSLTPDSYRDPGYPFFLALLIKAFGTGDAWYASVLLFQALLGALTVTLTTQLGKLWLPSRWALAAGLLMAIWPHSLSINGYLLSETLFGFLCALGIWLAATACRRESSYWSLAAGVALGAAALTNAVLLPFGLLLAAFLAWRRLAGRSLCIALAAGALLLPGAWAIRNSQLPASASGESSRSRALQNFAQGASPDFHKAYRASFFGNAQEKIDAGLVLHAVEDQSTLLANSPVTGAQAFMRQLARQPLRYALWYLIEKPHEFWDWDIVIGQGDIYVYPTVNSPFKTQRPWMIVEVVCRALNLLLMLLAAACVLLLLFRPSLFLRPELSSTNRSSSPALLIPVACLLTFVTIIYCLLQEEPRYSIPFRSSEILMAFTAVLVASGSWQRRRRSMRVGDDAAAGEGAAKSAQV